MKFPNISVIIPTYNRANLIRNTIQGVIDQTYTDWELLIVDDGSTDNTRDIVNQFMSKDSRIKYFYEEASGGPSAPRNLGINNALGKYVAFLDSDDLWFPTKLKKQLDIFEKSNNPKLGIVACYLYVKDYKTGEIISKHDKYYRGDVIKELMNFDFNVFTSSCIMTKLSILKEVGPFDTDLNLSEDFDLWLRISDSGYEFDYVPEYLFNYVKHDSNIFYSNNNVNKQKESLLFMNKVHDLYLKHNLHPLAAYYIYNKDYKMARKILFTDILSNKTHIRQKLRILGQIIITYCPYSEKIWKNIKKLWKK